MAKDSEMDEMEKFLADDMELEELEELEEKKKRDQERVPKTAPPVPTAPRPPPPDETIVEPTPQPAPLKPPFEVSEESLRKVLKGDA